MRIAVLGAGAFGCSIANILKENGHDVYLWTHTEEDEQLLKRTNENPHILGVKLEPGMIITSNFNIVNEVELIVVVVPSFALRSTFKKINEELISKKDFVICTKGLESGTQDSGYKILEEEVKKVGEIAILSGPTHAEELACKKLTTIVSTSYNLEFAKKVQKLFSNNYLRVYTNQDVPGVEILGAAKNVLAIAAGVCDSNERLGDNAKAALLTRGLRELKIIGEAEGAKPDTFYGLTGLGDLIVTATSRHSRNRKFGELIGQGYTKDDALEMIGQVVEGLYSVEAVHELQKKYNLDLPIIEVIYRTLYQNQDINEVLEYIFSRSLKSEF